MDSRSFIICVKSEVFSWWGETYRKKSDLEFDRCGHCWTSNRPAWSKIEGRLQISKCWNLLIRTARWVVSQTRVLQRSNNQKHFHRTFIKSVHVGRFFIGRRNRPTLLQSIFSSFVSLGSCKTTLKTHTPSSCLGPSSPSDLWTCYVCVSIHSSAFFLMGS